MPFWKCFPCRKFKNDEIITILDHSNCTLTDVPPDVLQHERTLEELYLSSNRISSLSPQLFYCQGMRVLFVNDNELESLPSAIGSLRHLNSLNLARNSLTTIPENITSCKNLTRLDLSLNNLQKLPDAITGLIGLQELFLNETNLEFLPANFGRLVNLRILELRSNNLMTLPKSMSRLCNLQRIDIGANEFTELPEVICQLTQLRELWIDVNRIRRISPNVAYLRELKHFEANNNLLTTLPNEISHWRNLEVFSVSINEIESLPFSIGMLKSLVTLQCEANQLRELPDSICHLENLEELVINHNLIMRLPRTIGMLRKLRFFCADQNILRSLPIEICSCSNLAVLSVRMNKIVELPQNIGHLENLQVLNLVDNFISHLPVSVLSLTKLTALWISDNQSQPLVPLQYLNANTKSELTCFMLPQQAGQQNLKQTIEYSDDDSVNSLQRQQQQQGNDQDHQEYSYSSQRIYFADQQQQDSVELPGNRSTGPGGRICFADTNGVGCGSESDPDTSPLRRIYFADEVKGSENLGTRLMRSPTPYPKELRLMAKLVRNNQQQKKQQQQRHYLDAMLVPVPNASSPRKQEEPLLSETLPSSTGGGSVKEARILLNPSVNSVFLQQVPPTFVNFDPNRGEDLSNDLSKVQYLNPYSENDGILMPTQQQQYFNRFQPHYLDQQQYPSHSPLLYDHHQLQQQQQPDLTGMTLLMPETSSTAMSPSPRNFQQSSQHLQSLYDTQNTTKPPPYHIARTYTKKSREDLLNYDQFHSKMQHQHINGEQADDNDTTSRRRSNSFHHSPALNDNQNHVEMDLTSQNAHCYFNNENGNDSGIVDHQNNNSNTLNRSFSLDCPDGAPLHRGNSLISLQVGGGYLGHGGTLEQNWNGDDEQQQDTSRRDRTPTNTPGPDLKPPPPRSASTTAWLFGLHKNPTVKQVAIKRDQDIGFEIVERSNQGIFVSETQPNTSAALLLHANDKLLEVNGFDFTKIRLVDAQKILENSGPLLNVMISRT